MSNTRVLVHYGVPGMKWGIQNVRSTLASKQKQKQVDHATTAVMRAVKDLSKRHGVKAKQSKNAEEQAHYLKNVATLDRNLAEMRKSSIGQSAIKRGRRETAAALAILGSMLAVTAVPS